MPQVLLLFVALITSTSVAVDRPNIVFLLADDLGWTGLKSFGSDFYETPNLDQLTAEGMKFTNTYSACTVCSPTRASIMTGSYPARLHLTDFIPGQNRPLAKLSIPNWQQGLLHSHVTLAEALRATGYSTAMVGKWHLERPNHRDEDMPTKHGFDYQYLKPNGTKGYFLSPKVQKETGHTYLTDYLTEKATEFIHQSAADPKPFFLYMAYHVPHTPIEGRKDLVDKFAAKVNPQAIHHNPIYAAMVASLDQSVGKILDSLKKTGQDSNTLVVFTSDNGGLTHRNGKHDDFTENLPLRRGKGSAYEGGVRVPGIARWPSVIQPGTICDTPIMTIDFYPTLLEAANSKYDASTIDGVNLRPVFEDNQKTFNRNLYWHYPHYHAGGDSPYGAVRSGDYRLIEFYEDNHLELYNLREDLGEQTNLADQMPKLRDELYEDLKSWRSSVSAQMPTINANFKP